MLQVFLKYNLPSVWSSIFQLMSYTAVARKFNLLNGLTKILVDKPLSFNRFHFNSTASFHFISQRYVLLYDVFVSILYRISYKPKQKTKPAGQTNSNM